MYVSKLPQQPDREAVRALVENNPLGAWVCHCDGELVAKHVPYFLDRSQGRCGTLIGHVARANGVWKQLTSTTPSLVMVRGPQSLSGAQ